MLKIDINKKLYGANGEMNLEVKCAIKQGEFVAISGKSGSGKTTFLRVLAGLDEAFGSIEFNDVSWLRNFKTLAIQKRNIGFVFQDYALFENMTVEENLLFVNKDEVLAKYLLEVTELSKLKKQLPKHLSGGQKQRVAFCRALMTRPKILFLDEALSALDMKMRMKLQNELLKLNKEHNLTIIMVSHDASDIYRLASRVLVLEHGKVVSDGTAKEVMMKEENRLEGEVLEFSECGLVTLLVGQQLIEMQLSQEKLRELKVGQFISLVNHKML